MKSAMLAALLVWGPACATIPSGHAGVLLRAGGVAAAPLPEGEHVVGPFARVYVYDLRAQEKTEDLGRYTPEEIYSTKRDVIEREIREGLRTKIEGKHIDLEAVLIRNVQLPDTISRAIDQKLAAEQEVLKMKYVLEVAKSSAEQRRIDAQGIADYNRTVANSLTPQILEFQRVQELGQVAAAPNAKTVVLGSGAINTPVLIAPSPAAR